MATERQVRERAQRAEAATRVKVPTRREVMTGTGRLTVAEAKRAAFVLEQAARLWPLYGGARTRNAAAKLRVAAQLGATRPAEPEPVQLREARERDACGASILRAVRERGASGAE